MTRRGRLRVYVGPEPDGPGHPGYRGVMSYDELGVWPNSNCEWLLSSLDGNSFEWEPVEAPCLVPWHRIHLIEWSTR